MFEQDRWRLLSHLELSFSRVVMLDQVVAAKTVPKGIAAPPDWFWFPLSAFQLFSFFFRGKTLVDLVQCLTNDGSYFWPL